MGPASGSARIVIAIGLLAAIAAAVVWLLLEPAREEAAPVPAYAGAPVSPRVDPPPSEEQTGRRPATPVIRPAPLVDRDAPAPEQTGSGTVRVEVLQGDGSPAASALVFVGSADRHSFLGYPESLRAEFARIKSAESRPAGVQVATTDARGAYEFRDVKPAWRLTVGAWHPQLGIVTSFGNVIRDGEIKSVVLKMPGAIRMLGYVTEPDGKPVAGAQVQVLGAGEQGSSSRLELVQTDADGRYETSRWPGAGFTLVVTTPQHNDTRKNVQNVGPGEVERRVDFQLERARILRGRLVLADGSPAKVAEHIAPHLDPRDPDAKFQLTLAFEDPLARGGWASTDRSEGQVNDRDDTYEVPMKRMARFVGLAFNRKVLGSAPIPGDKSAPGPDIVVDWSRLPRLVPRGNLVVFARSHADGKPLTQYTLQVERMSAIPSERSASTFEVKSIDGRHFVERLQVGRYRVKVGALGFETAITEFEVLADPAENEVLLTPAPAWATIAGRVITPAGKPIAGATVSREADRIDIVGLGAWPKSPVSMRTGDDGTFRFEELAFGTYRLHAEAEGFAPAWGAATARPADEAVTITLSEGVAVEVVPEGDTGPFRLLVEDSASRVILAGDGGTGLSFESRVTVRLMPGRYEAHVIGAAREGRKSFEAAERTSVSVPLAAKK